MPKRGWSDAARAKSLAVRRAKATGKPVGKSTIVYHHTTPANAAKIMKGGFKSGKVMAGDRNIYFSNVKRGAAGMFGPTAIGVKVPRRKLKKDTNAFAGAPGIVKAVKGEKWYKAPASSLKNAQIKSVSGKRTRKRKRRKTLSLETL